jgi:hypothetical protein
MYQVDTKVFLTLEEATDYANWIAKISRIILAIEEIE